MGAELCMAPHSQPPQAPSVLREEEEQENLGGKDNAVTKKLFS